MDNMQERMLKEDELKLLSTSDDFNFSVSFDDGSKFENSFLVKGDILFVKIRSENKSSEDIFLTLTTLWEEIAKEKNCAGVLLSCSLYTDRVGQLADFLNKLGYHFLSNKQQEIANWTDKAFERASWFKSLKENSIENYCNLLASVCEVFDEISKKDITMTYNLNNFTSGIFSFYYQGIDETITFEKNGLSLSTSFGSNSYTGGNDEEIKKITHDIFNKISKTQRIRNVLNPPKKHFFLFMEHILGRKKTELTDGAFSELLHAGYTYQEIEEGAILAQRNFMFDDFLFFISFLEHILIINEVSKKITIFKMSEKDNAFSFYKKTILEKKEKELLSKFSHFDF